MPQFDLVVAGEINPDLILDHPPGEIQFHQAETIVSDYDLVMGSSSVIFACGAAKLGLKVAFVGLVGEDLFGQFMLRNMRDHGLDVKNVIVDPEHKTGISVILNRYSDRAILTYPGAMAHLRADQIPDDLLRDTCHLHIASYFLQTNLQPGALDLFKRAKGMGLSVSFDTNWDPTEKWRGLAELFHHIDIFFPNETEFISINEQLININPGLSIPELVPITAVKKGGAGAEMYHNGIRYSCPALPSNVIDTVGAGDTFDAGFVYGYLQGWDLAKSLQMAVVCGSLSTQKRGGTSGQPSLEEAMNALNKIRSD